MVAREAKEFGMAEAILCEASNEVAVAAAELRRRIGSLSEELDEWCDAVFRSDLPPDAAKDELLRRRVRDLVSEFIDRNCRGEWLPLPAESFLELESAASSLARRSDRWLPAKPSVGPGRRLSRALTPEQIAEARRRLGFDPDAP